MRKLTIEEFKKKFHEKFGDRYILDEAVYVNNKTPITVICPIHGRFEKRPDELMDGGKCPKCSKTNRMSESEFIKEATYVHNGFFTYENCGFKNVSSEVFVTCPIHGVWKPKANNHLNGMNCPKCSNEGITHTITMLPKRNASTKRYNTDTFIDKCKSLYGDKFSYDKVEYVNNRSEVIITCLKHGDFKVTPNHFLSGRGCPKCAGNYRYTTDEIIEEFKRIHGEKYDYSKVLYESTHKNVTVICKEHGEFEVSPANHLRGEGCPICNRSILENEIASLLDANNICYDHNVRNIPFLNGLELDFYLPEYKVGVECQGIQHFKPITIFGGDEAYSSLLERDVKKRELCDKNGIKLLYFSNLGIEYPYMVYEKKEELLNEIFGN